VRNYSYGQKSKLSIVDKFGVYLSKKMVLKYLSAVKKTGIAVLDLGCGYDAALLRKLAPRTSLAYGVDVAVSDEVKSLKDIRICEGTIEESLVKFDSGYFDIVMMINVLEHLDEPLVVLKECHRLLNDDGLLLINVPTWTGKFFLETSAFVFKMSPASEVNDHKTYFDKKGLWPLLVKANFYPSAIRMKYHKFGLNLFASCRKRGP
jgi:SAM-dependent methyltransferase